MSDKPIDPKRLISHALNEHGFLLQQVIRKRLEGPVEDSSDPLEKWEDKWRFVAAEYPGTGADGSQTRIARGLNGADAPGWLYAPLFGAPPLPNVTNPQLPYQS